LFDSGLALVAAGLSTAFFVGLVGRGVPRGMLALAYALALLHTLPLAARRRFPGPYSPSVSPVGWRSRPLACRQWCSGWASLLGILGMATEFRHQTVTQTFLVTPDRGRVVAAN
jgi:ABC-2 type transport system permease protein